MASSTELHTEFYYFLLPHLDSFAFGFIIPTKYRPFSGPIGPRRIYKIIFGVKMLILYAAFSKSGYLKVKEW